MFLIITIQSMIFISVKIRSQSSSTSYKVSERSHTLQWTARWFSICCIVGIGKVESIGPGKVYLNWISKQTGTSLEIVTVICSIFPYLLDLWPIPELFVEGCRLIDISQNLFLHEEVRFLIRVGALLLLFMTFWEQDFLQYDDIISSAGKQYMHCDDILKAVWRSCDDNCDHSVTTAWRHRYASMTAVWRCVTTERQRVCR